MRNKKIFASLLMAICLLFSACGQIDVARDYGYETEETWETSEEASSKSETSETSKTAENTEDSENLREVTVSFGIVFLDIPEYSGDAYVAVNDNVPYFTEDEITTEAFETYSDLDELGRCGVAFANICKEVMPADGEERGSISSVTPSGWDQLEVDGVDGGYLYNRCHLIGYQLAGENANEKNLITGTRYLNIEGMLPFENLVDDYVDETENHVLYRVTPIFTDNNLVADGVLMEGYSVEDDGEGIMFCVYCYNVQPGVTIDYATGEAQITGNTSYDATADFSETNSEADAETNSESFSEIANEDEERTTYIINTKTKKIHTEDCSSVEGISVSNKQIYYGYKSDLIEQGYEACKNCNP